MRQGYYLFGVCLLVSALTSCAALESKPAGSATGNGPDYSLPKGLVNLELWQHKSKPNTYAIKYLGVTYVSDNDFEYALQYNSSAFSTDNILITKGFDKTNKVETGLLEQVKFEADDKTGAFIVKLAELAKAAVKAPAAFSPSALVVDVTNFDKLLYRGHFDPLSESDTKRMNKLLAKKTNATSPISVELVESKEKIANPDTGVEETVYQYTNQVADRKDCTFSVCFRKARSYELKFNSAGSEFFRVNVLLPDKSKIGGVEVGRAAFVKKVTTIDFENGMLKSFNIIKPSEALAAIQVPIDVLNAIIAIPGELLKFKFDNTKAAEDLHNARLNELKARQSLIEFQQKQNSSSTTSDPILAPNTGF